MTLKDHLATNLCLNISVSVDKGGRKVRFALLFFAERSCTSQKIPVAGSKENYVCCSYQKPFELGQVCTDAGRERVRGKS